MRDSSIRWSDPRRRVRSYLRWTAFGAGIVLTVVNLDIGLPVLTVMIIWVVVGKARGAQAETAGLRVMSSGELEQTLAALCGRDGCTAVRRAGGVADLESDIVAVLPDRRRLVLRSRWATPAAKLGTAEIQALWESRQLHGADLVVLVTDSPLTPAARTHATKLGIRIFGEMALADWASHTGPAPWN